MRRERGAAPALLRDRSEQGTQCPHPTSEITTASPLCVYWGPSFQDVVPSPITDLPNGGVPGRWPGQSTSGQRRRRSRQVRRTTTLFGNWRYPTGERLLPHPSCPASHAGATQGMRSYVPQSDLHANRLWRFGFERTSAALSHMKHGSESTRAEPTLHRCTRRIGRAG